MLDSAQIDRKRKACQAEKPRMSKIGQNAQERKRAQGQIGPKRQIGQNAKSTIRPFWPKSTKAAPRLLLVPSKKLNPMKPLMTKPSQTEP